MKVTEKAYNKALKKAEPQEMFDKCIEQNVCPECAKELKIEFSPTRYVLITFYECKCGFKHRTIYTGKK